jgi:hypothetical protein
MSHAQVVAAVAVRKTLLKWDDVVGDEKEGEESSPLAWAAALAADCWKEDPAERPSFAEICERLRAELARMRGGGGGGEAVKPSARACDGSVAAAVSAPPAALAA